MSATTRATMIGGLLRSDRLEERRQGRLPSVGILRRRGFLVGLLLGRDGVLGGRQQRLQEIHAREQTLFMLFLQGLEPFGQGLELGLDGVVFVDLPGRFQKAKIYVFLPASRCGFVYASSTDHPSFNRICTRANGTFNARAAADIE
jgi:hypothetical protein